MISGAGLDVRTGKPSVEDLEVPGVVAGRTGSQKLAQRASCPALSADDLPEVTFDDGHFQSAPFTLNSLIDLDSLPFIYEKRDDVQKIFFH